MTNWAEIMSAKGDVMLINLDKVDAIFRRSDGKADILFRAASVAMPVGETYEQMFQLIKGGSMNDVVTKLLAEMPSVLMISDKLERWKAYEELLDKYRDQLK